MFEEESDQEKEIKMKELRWRNQEKEIIITFDVWKGGTFIVLYTLLLMTRVVSVIMYLLLPFREDTILLIIIKQGNGSRTKRIDIPILYNNDHLFLSSNLTQVLLKCSQVKTYLNAS